MSTVLAWALAALSVAGVAGASWVVFAVASELKLRLAQAYGLARCTRTQITVPAHHLPFRSRDARLRRAQHVQAVFAAGVRTTIKRNVAFIAAAVFVASHLKKMPIYALAYAVIVGGVPAVSRPVAGTEEDRHGAAHRAALLSRAKHPGVKRVLVKMVPPTCSSRVRRPVEPHH